MLLYGLFHQAVVVSSLLLIIASIALTNRLFMCLKIAGSSSFFLCDSAEAEGILPCPSKKVRQFAY